MVLYRNGSSLIKEEKKRRKKILETKFYCHFVSTFISLLFIYYLLFENFYCVCVSSFHFIKEQNQTEIKIKNVIESAGSEFGIQFILLEFLDRIFEN